MKYITNILTCILLMFAVSCKKEKAPAKDKKDPAAATTDTEVKKDVPKDKPEETKKDE